MLASAESTPTRKYLPTILPHLQRSNCFSPHTIMLHVRRHREFVIFFSPLFSPNHNTVTNDLHWPSSSDNVILLITQRC
jgi:hypothetical protein